MDIPHLWIPKNPGGPSSPQSFRWWGPRDLFPGMPPLYSPSSGFPQGGCKCSHNLADMDASSGCLSFPTVCTAGIFVWCANQTFTSFRPGISTFIFQILLLSQVSAVVANLIVHSVARTLFWDRHLHSCKVTASWLGLPTPLHCSRTPKDLHWKDSSTAGCYQGKPDQGFTKKQVGTHKQQPSNSRESSALFHHLWNSYCRDDWAAQTSQGFYFELREEWQKILFSLRSSLRVLTSSPLGKKSYRFLFYI